MSYQNTLAVASGSWQPAQALQGLSPDTARLLGPIVPSGIAIGSPAAAYIGNGWASGAITATGATWAMVATSRHGRHTVRDRRNLLVGAEATAYRNARAKWQRDHGNAWETMEAPCSTMESHSGEDQPW